MTTPRPTRIEGDVAYVPLTRGYEAVIDAADAHLVSQWNWSALVCKRKDGSARVYAVRVGRIDGKQRMVLMHRFLAGTPSGYDTDHADGNSLHNFRSNLRPATRPQNAQNARLRSDNTSGVKGVTWAKRERKWKAQISHQGRHLNLGDFDTIEAAKAVVLQARAELHGQFGRAT
ncbi:MAG: hypothetical protein ACK5VE_03710 [Alphaproteobacteria bacterium]